MKLTTAIGFHMGTPSFADGIGDYWRTLAQNGHAIVSKGVGGGGPAYELQRLSEEFSTPAYGIWRMDSLNGRSSDVPIYGSDPAAEALFYWDEVDRQWPKELNKSFAWVEFPNEVDKNASVWLNKFSLECARIALERGYKWLCPGWSGGEPEPHHWIDWLPYLRLCEKHPDQLGISLHEYTFTDQGSLLDHVPFLIGRVTWLNDVCVKNGIKPPTVFITEFGYGSTSAPEKGFAVDDIVKAVEWYIVNAPNVLGVVLWALDSGSEWGDLNKTVNSYIQPLKEAIIEKDWPQKEEVDSALGLKNPSFGSRGWTDIPGTNKQQPEGWNLTYTEVGRLLPSGRAVATSTTEDVHKFVIPTPPDVNPTLPPEEGRGGTTEGHTWDEERDGLVLVDPNVFKIFGTGKMQTRLSQNVLTGEPNSLFEFKGYVDIHWHGFPAGDNPPEEEDVVVSLVAGGNQKQYVSVDFPDRTWHEITVEGRTDENGEIRVVFDVEFFWGHPRSVFLGGFALNQINEPITGYKAVIFKGAQEHTPEESVEIFKIGMQEYGRDFTRSHDTVKTILDHGNEDSYVVIWDPWLPSQAGTIRFLLENGYTMKNIEEREWRARPANPFQGLKFGFLFNQPYTMTSEMDEQRDYSAFGGLQNDKHEGVDYDVLVGERDSKAKVLAAYDGRVISTITSSGYGKQVKVLSTYNGSEFTLTYAHLDTQDVSVNQTVLAGDEIGEIGSTGNSFGEHLHITMQSIEGGLGGYIVPFVVNPEQFFSHPHKKYVTINPSFPVYDIGAYMAGDGRSYVIRTTRGEHTGSTEGLQVQSEGNKHWLVKNTQYEFFIVTDSHIERGIDTSPDGTNFYVQFQPGHKTTPWCKRFMRIGEHWQADLTHRVQFFDKQNCEQSRPDVSGWARNSITFVDHYDNHPKLGTLVDIIELKTSTGESMFFCRGYGLVGWASAWAESWFDHDLQNVNLHKESGCFDSWSK